MFYILNFNEFRKNRMEKLFLELDICDYEFIDAIDPYSPIIKDYIEKYDIKNQFGCVICNNTQCNHTINFFTRFHISNFFGFAKMIKIFYQSNKEFAIMCEDDLVTLPWTKNGLKFLFSKIKLSKNPLIIRLGLGKRYKCFEEKKFKLEKKIKIGNVCFLINKKFAELYLKKIEKIKKLWQSDVFIHRRCLFKGIETYSLNPCIFRDFSSHKSLIRRKPNPLDFYGITVKKYWEELIFTLQPEKILNKHNVYITSKYHPKYDLREFDLEKIENYTDDEKECIQFFNFNIFKIKNIL